MSTDVAVKLHVYRLDDGTLYYRLPDSEIATLQGMGYSSGQDRVNYAGHDDEHGCRVRGYGRCQ